MTHQFQFAALKARKWANNRESIVQRGQLNKKPRHKFHEKKKILRKQITNMDPHFSTFQKCHINLWRTWQVTLSIFWSLCVCVSLSLPVSFLSYCLSAFSIVCHSFSISLSSLSLSVTNSNFTQLCLSISLWIRMSLSLSLSLSHHYVCVCFYHLCNYPIVL